MSAEDKRNQNDDDQEREAWEREFKEILDNLHRHHRSRPSQSCRQNVANWINFSIMSKHTRLTSLLPPS